METLIGLLFGSILFGICRFLDMKKNIAKYTEYTEKPYIPIIENGNIKCTRDQYERIPENIKFGIKTIEFKE